MAEAELRITVDHDRCVGSRMCVQIAPHTFALDENGQSIVTDPAGDPCVQILEAAENCPTMAIAVFDARSGRALFPPSSG